jgi:hypothetical protein
MEGGDELRKVGDLDALGDGCADGGAACAGSINIFTRLNSLTTSSYLKKYT